MRNQRWFANGCKSVALLATLAMAAVPVASADEVAGEGVAVDASEESSEPTSLGRGAVTQMVVNTGTTLVDSLYIHAFGSWAWGKTVHTINEYEEGAPDSVLDNVDGGLVVGAKPMDRIRIHSQIYFEKSDVRLNYLFAELSVFDELEIRAGKFSQPFGLYSEILEIGTLRPFYSLPINVYGDAGFTAISISGVDFSGRFDLGGGWAARYDAYAGAGEVLEGLASLEGGDNDELSPTAGARLQVEPPIDGLLVGVAGYWGRHDGIVVSTGFPPPNDVLQLGVAEVNHGVVGAQLQYLNGPWTVRSEYYHQWEDTNYETNTVYVEAAYKYFTNLRFLESIELAARYEWLRTDIHLDLMGFAFENELKKHDNVGVGLNFWVSPNLVAKFSYDHVWGNRFANHADAEVGDDFYDHETDMVRLGVQFSF